MVALMSPQSQGSCRRTTRYHVSGSNGGSQVTAYTVIFEEGEANWFAYVPDLPGCVAAAATREETELLVAEAIALHLELIREDGDPIPQPRSTAKLVSIRA